MSLFLIGLCDAASLDDVSRKKLQASHQTLFESVPLGLMERMLAHKFVRGMYHPDLNEKSIYDEFDDYLKN